MTVSPPARRIGSLVLVLLVLAGSAPLAAGLLPSAPLAPVLAAGAAWAPLPTALLLLVAAGLRLRLVAGLAMLSLTVQAAMLLPLVVGERAPGGPALTVMSVNLHVGYASTQQVVAEARRHDVDVLAVQELTPYAVEAMQEAGLEELLPYSVVHAGGGPSGSGLWSRHELTPATAWDTSFRSSAGRLQWRGLELTVQSVHPYAPAARDARQWERDLLLLQAAADADPATPRTVVAGDLNGTLGHQQIRRLLEGRWRDAAELAGAGQLRTWTPSRRLPALIDLDHVLVPPGLAVRSVRAVTIVGSDHRAVVARLVPVQ